MAIDPCSRTAADKGLEWWPNALPDSPLWRWLPLLLAIQAQQPGQWRWRLNNTDDQESTNLLLNVLKGNEGTDDEKYDLVIINRWYRNSNQIKNSASNQDCSILGLKEGGLILSLPNSSQLDDKANKDLFWTRPDIAIYKLKQSNWLANLEGNISKLLERGLYLQRLADSNAIDLRKHLQIKNQLLLKYAQRVNELEKSSSWRMTEPLRQLADRLRNQEPTGCLPEISKLSLKLNMPAARSPVDAARELSETSIESRLLEQKGKQLHRHERKTILIVIHEASLTGAPILAWNLTDDLKNDHNLIILSLRRGALEQDLLNHCTWLITPSEENEPFDYKNAEQLINYLVKKDNLSWALLNSIETWRWSKMLGQHGTPCVMLIHEFATYCTEKDAFKDACIWSAKVVLSSPATHIDMKRVFPELKETPIEMLPQGRCQIPGHNIEREPISPFKPFRLSSIPELNHWHNSEWLDECSLIVGSGTLAPRKGADLFISVCNRVLNRSTKPVLCLWLAGPDRTSDYKTTRMWCDDQIRRSGIEGHVMIIHAHEHYESLMRRADLFLLTSRLDPLPNVTLDSMHNGIPTLTFSQASGTASWLELDPWLRKRCVAPYLDTNAMAEQARHLLDNRDEHIKVGTKVKDLAKKTFSMSSYKQKIRGLGEHCVEYKEQKEKAIKQIMDSKVFDPDMAISPHSSVVEMAPMISHYLQCWKRKIGMRKPFAGFHPGLFADHHPDIEGDPLQTWLKHNRPLGPWQQRVLSLDSESIKLKTQNRRIGLHIHVHYLDLLEEIIERIKFNQAQPKLWISITNPELEYSISELLCKRGLDVAKIQCFLNRGRNFGPLLQGLGEELDQECDLYAHLHTKRSQHLNPKDTKQWRKFLMDHLLGQDGCPVMDNIVDAFEQDPNLGMVFADDPHCIGWTENQESARLLMKKLELNTKEQNLIMPREMKTVDFPIGSMFWIRSRCLSRVWTSKSLKDVIPKEPLANDGTVMHALERLLPGLCRLEGFTTAVTHIPGSRR